MPLPELHASDGHSISLSKKSNTKNTSKSIPLFNFPISGDRLIRLLFRITGVLIVIHLINLALGGPSWQIERLFCLGEEANVPTWFSSALWAFTAFASYCCSILVESKKARTLWICITLGFLAFSIDEVAMIHENLFEVMSRFFPDGVRSHILVHFKATNWPVIAAPFLILTVTWLILTFKRLLSGSKTAQKLLILGFAVTIFGGWGLELTTNFLNHDNLQWVWEIESVFEESLEMIGAIIILSGLLRHLNWLSVQVDQCTDQPESRTSAKREIQCQA